MDVVHGVAIVAGCKQFNLLFDRFAVTCGAYDAFMGAGQFKIRLLVMVKNPGFPVRSIVASLAHRAQGFLMLIVFLMA